MPLDPDPLKDILYRTTARYLAVRPAGLEIAGHLQTSLQGRVLAYGAARSLYRGKRPVCRSLDGLRSVHGEPCAACHEQPHCTPQARLDLLLDAIPHRLLLAYTSAKNFLLYVGALATRGLDVTRITTHMEVVDRGTWGEVRFRQA
ncbi:MAG: hypothetical protein AB1486_22625 [Planctomycetota bacterium]